MSAPTPNEQPPSPAHLWPGQDHAGSGGHVTMPTLPTIEFRSSRPMRKSNSESRRVDGVTRGDNLIYALLQTVLEDVHVPRPVVGDVVGE